MGEAWGTRRGAEPPALPAAACGAPSTNRVLPPQHPASTGQPPVLGTLRRPLRHPLVATGKGHHGEAQRSPEV